MSEERTDVPEPLVEAAAGRDPNPKWALPGQAAEPAPPLRRQPTVSATRFIITCEHGGNRVPARYRHLFAGHEEVLASHRGYDPGALVLARQMARALGAPLVASMTSRLVVDLNRSPGHPRLHAEPIRQASDALRREILARHYRAYRRRVETLIEEALARGERVLHISSHSFTPVLDHHVRRADIGLLYDPARPAERRLCEHWRATLHAHAPGLVVRRNYPYTGKSDGLCTYLRRQFPGERYAGIELEVNQKHVFQGGREWERLRRTVVAALADAIGRLRW